MIILRRSAKRKVIDEWALVLVTQGVTASVLRTPEGLALGVQPGDFARAAAALAAHDREKTRSPDHQEARPAGRGYLWAGLSIPLALFLFYLITGPRDAADRWFARGSADAGPMLAGEPWRAVTALTLHADFLHVLVNGILAAVLLSASFRLIGAGLGGALVLAAGAGGNFLNALIQGAPHNAVGASTAVFGAVGLLAGLGFMRRRRTDAGGWRAWGPFAAGLGLLAFVGTAGERTDLWAHLLGFLLGCVLGVLAARVFPRPPGRRAQWAFGSAAVAAVLLSWAAAL